MMRNNKKVKSYIFQIFLCCIIVAFCTGCTKKKDEYAGSYYGNNLKYTIGESLATVKGGKWETQGGFVRFIIPANEQAWRLKAYQIKEKSEDIGEIFAICYLPSMLIGQTTTQCLDETLGQIIANAGIKYNSKNTSKIRELILSNYPAIKSGLDSSNSEERMTSIFNYGILSTSAIMVARVLKIEGKKDVNRIILQFEDEPDNRFSIRNSRGEEYDEFIYEAFLSSEVRDYYLPIYEIAQKINTIE